MVKIGFFAVIQWVTGEKGSPYVDIFTYTFLERYKCTFRICVKKAHNANFGAKNCKKKGPHLAHFLFFLKNVLFIKLEILNFHNLVSFRQHLYIERKNVGFMWKF